MFKEAKAYSGFAVKNMEEAKKFYGEVLGLTTSELPMGMDITLGTGAHVFVYQETEHEAGSYTIMYLPTDNIEKTFDALAAKGVVFEVYNDPDFITTNEKGIMDGGDHKIAWFKDPSGNFLAVIQTQKSLV